MTAKEYALRALDRRDYSARELTRKLLEKGYEEAETAAAVERLMELGFVDDARYAPLLVRHYAAKGYGAQRVKQELHKRGIPRELWDAAMEEMPQQDDTVDRLRFGLSAAPRLQLGRDKICPRASGQRN